jgi:hypothetical protein
MNRKNIILSIVVGLFVFPGTCLSACPEGSACNWVYVETVNRNTVNISNPVNVCAIIVQNSLSQYACSNFSTGGTVSIRSNIHEVIYSNSNSGHCSWTDTIYRNDCIHIPTCYDYIKNQGETGIDCGGPCICCTLSVYYPDGDGDGYGGVGPAVQACTAPAGYADTATDCNDIDPAINPGKSEICGDGKDNDCKNGGDCLDSACKGSPSCFTRAVEGGICTDQ